MTPWIVPENFRRPTPNKHGAGDPRNLPVEFLVFHFTAGGFPGCLKWMCMPEARASAHFLVTKSGEVYQLASLAERCWHAGGTQEHPSIWPGDSRAMVNDRSIGIELEAHGIIHQAPAGWWLDELGASVHNPILFQGADGQTWDDFSPPQIQALLGLVDQLMTEFPCLTEGGDRLVGHSDVDPGRKVDPGPSFPWARVRALCDRSSK